MSYPYKEINSYRYSGELKQLHEYPSFVHEFPIIASRMGNGYRILDLGCGEGRFYNDYLVATGMDVEYVGLDNDPSLEGKVNFPLYANVEELKEVGYDTRYFDGLMMMDFIEHLYPDELYPILLDVNPLIDGDAFIMTPNWRSLDYIHNDSQHKTVYPLPEIYGLLKHLGFNKIDIYRGKGLYRRRKLEFEKNRGNKELEDMMLFQRKVCAALGLDWYGNLLVIGDRAE